MGSEEQNLGCRHRVVNGEIERPAQDISEGARESKERAAEVIVVCPLRERSRLEASAHLEKSGDMTSGIPSEQDAGIEVRLPTPADDNGEERDDDTECRRRKRKVERAQRRHQLGGRDGLAAIEEGNRHTLHMRERMK